MAKSPDRNKILATVGIIVAGSAPPIEGFKEGLAEFAWIEERNVNFAIRIAQGQINRLPGFASEIIGLKVELLAIIGAVNSQGRSESNVDHSHRLFSSGRTSRQQIDHQFAAFRMVTLPECPPSTRSKLWRNSTSSRC
jgi:hypothetical protein